MEAHRPVLVREVLEYLNIRPDETVLDATAGSGGHSAEILARLSPRGRLLLLDRDPTQVERLRQRFGADPRVEIVHGNFSALRQVWERRGPSLRSGRRIHGILFDLGLAREQITDPARGFSFQAGGPLDMRYDPTEGEPAWSRLRRLQADEIAEILRKYGEERRARPLGRRIAAARPQTTAELARLCASLPGGGRIHPATRAFQAIRIWVNEELDHLQRALPEALSLLAPEGRLVAITFHSLEDRIVKNFFRESARSGLLRILTKKPVRPSEEEIRTNPSSRSAKLRAAESRRPGQAPLTRLGRLPLFS